MTRAVAGLRSRVSALVDVPLWSMPAAEAASTLVELTRLSAQVAELELRVAAHADCVGVGEATGATSAAAWWAHAGRLTRREAHGKVRLAQALDGHRARVRDALAEGSIVVEQAAVIVRALEELPHDLGPAVVTKAEQELVALAHEHDARTLRVLGRRILDVIAPDVAEAHEARLLAAEEREARDSARFTMADDGHGRCHGRFTLPSAQGAMLHKALVGFAAPKHRAAIDGTAGERRPSPQRLGRAFLEYVERFPATDLPSSGGVNATVVVTMDLESLIEGTGVASLDTGQSITASQARRLACEAGIIPAVLGTASQVLDLGRRRRFHTRAQRIALSLRDKGCTADGCDAPPGLCHAHHDRPWSTGGRTSVTGGRLLCARHHTRAHDPTYRITHLPGGKVAFTRRT